MKENTVNVGEVIRIMNQIAPPRLAMEGDVIGLQVGDMDLPVQKIWLALDASPAVIEGAIRDGVDMLITHHALLYRPLTQINTGTPKGRAIASAIKADLSIFNAHTNLDIVPGGVNDVLAERFGLQNVDILDVMGHEKLFKFVVYVPETHLAVVREALCDSGAGNLGNYSQCTYSSLGEGTFLPKEGTNPYIGYIGTVERVSEYRIEAIVPEEMRTDVWSNVRKAHPYEEIAHDWYALDVPGKPYGLGRIGDLQTQTTVAEFADSVRVTLGLKHVRFGGARNHPVRRVAVLGGSGGRWIPNAIAKGADVLVTSDCDHHSVADAWDEGLAVIDTTHAAMELPVLQFVKDRLQAELNGTVHVEVADVPEDPFTWI